MAAGAEAILVELAKSLVLSLASYPQEQVLLAWGLKTQLKKLQGTMEFINALLQEAQGMPGTNTRPTDQIWLNKLRDAVYEADDVFDEIRTRAERKKLMGGNAFSKEVMLFFSTSNQLFTSLMLARRIKSIREDLDGSSDDRSKFGNTIVTKREKQNNVVSIQGSIRDDVVYVPENTVGRENEKNEIISILFNSSLEETISVIPIVGIGGLGKTTLAQHVYNDDQVKQNFDLRLWVSIPRDFRLKDVVEKIVVASGQDSSNCDLDQLKIRLSGYINGKKYLLVLDDVWDENPPKWQDLKALLTRGAAPGSKMLVTTRSLTVGKIMGTVRSYQLRPLCEDDSWNLFEKIAFNGKGCPESSLREIGQDILEMCKNVPLAIRALAGVLGTKEFNSWSYFKNDELLNLASHGENFDVMAALRLSYDHLKPSGLKNCFSYCSLFPRGHVFDKNKMISLWIAQGFVDSSRKCQSVEDTGKEYIATLLGRSLLQDVEGDESGSSFKLHDLMYDLSCSVAGEQCKRLSSMESNEFGGSVRHISIGYQVESSWRVSHTLQSIKQLRSFLLIERPTYDTSISKSVCDNLIMSFRCLRALELYSLGIKKLPKSIGKLIHLRYLDLSNNLRLMKLPNSLTLLQNLQYFNLDDCWNLRGLPKDMKNLVNLRHLQLPSLLDLSYFPSGLGNLTRLQTLNLFVVPRVSVINHTTYARLSDLSSLNNLKGEILIRFNGSHPNMALDAEKANMKWKKNLKCLQIHWMQSDYYKVDEMVLENLQPNSQISKLVIDNYGGMKLPTWMGTNRLDSSLPNLAHIEIDGCRRIQHIPSFAQLPNLKSIRLARLENVEYLESSCVDEYEEASSSSPLSRCPVVLSASLIRIEICGMPKLKSWVRSGAGDHVSFPYASFMKIENCEKLEAMPWCPNVKELSLLRVSKNLKMWRADDVNTNLDPKLEILEIQDVDYLISLPKDCLHNVSNLTLRMYEEVEDLIRIGEAVYRMASLQTLKFSYCFGLKSLSWMPVQLSTLKRLEFFYCNYVDWAKDDTINAWKVLKGLRFLKFEQMYNLKVLPQGIQCISTLQSLDLRECYELGEIPDWIGDLCSLSRLEFYECPKIVSLPQEMRKLTKLELFVVDKCPSLADRCLRDVGQDWHKIPDTAEVIAKR